uniref:TGF-beta family profile domain-containing protein n=1 Tax=Timema bartmani TaxID=61472 RepID=A0A7R9F7B9_9NEOP|nr:unnamed protein product [Timema bartmani]
MPVGSDGEWSVRVSLVLQSGLLELHSNNVDHNWININVTSMARSTPMTLTFVVSVRGGHDTTTGQSLQPLLLLSYKTASKEVVRTQPHFLVMSQVQKGKNLKRVRPVILERVINDADKADVSIIKLLDGTIMIQTITDIQSSSLMAQNTVEQLGEGGATQVPQSVQASVIQHQIRWRRDLNGRRYLHISHTAPNTVAPRFEWETTSSQRSSSLPVPPKNPPQDPPPCPPLDPPPKSFSGTSPKSSLGPYSESYSGNYFESTSRKTRREIKTATVVEPPIRSSETPKAKLEDVTNEAVKASFIDVLKKSPTRSNEIKSNKKVSKFVSKPSRKDKVPLSLLNKWKPILKREVQERLKQGRSPGSRLKRSPSSDPEEYEEETNNVWDDDTMMTSQGAGVTPRKTKRLHRNTCRRRPLYVDFSEIHYDTWIVAPNGYEALATIQAARRAASGREAERRRLGFCLCCLIGKVTFPSHDKRVRQGVTVRRSHGASCRRSKTVQVLSLASETPRECGLDYHPSPLRSPHRGEDTKSKLKNLKDKFRKLMQKPPLRSGSATGIQKPSWNIFELMQYTRDVVIPSPMVGNLAKYEESEDDDNRDSASDIEEHGPLETILQPDTGRYNPRPDKGRSTASTSREIVDRFQPDTGRYNPRPDKGRSTASTSREIVDRFARPHRYKASSNIKSEMENKLIQLEERKLNAILGLQQLHKLLGGLHIGNWMKVLHEMWEITAFIVAGTAYRIAALPLLSYPGPNTWKLPGSHIDSCSAFQCVGKCFFPVSEHLSPTKHAIVQTLLHSVTPSKTARACCVPTRLEPISVLYMDHRGVLTYRFSYHDMVVAECGCR